MTSPAAAARGALLEVRGLTVRYGATVAVDAVDLDVPPVGITALLGPSGCGKTSLLRAIAGFGEVAAGTVRIAGQLVVGPRVAVPPERRRVGMVFQEGTLFPHLDVRGNVLYGLGGVADAADRADVALARVGLGHLGERFADELSGGQQQRVALARALAPEPRIVLLDEPFANLDAALRGRVREQVRQVLVDAGATAVLVTHDQEEALSVADRVAVMAQGRILQVAAPEEVYHRPASTEVARFLGDGQLLACEVRAGIAATALGPVRVAAADGPGQLLVRPEDLEVRPLEGAVGPRGIVARRRFYGHDLIDEVVLQEGSRETLKVRSLASDCPQIGAVVRLGLRAKPYTVYPLNANGAPRG